MSTKLWHSHVILAFSWCLLLSVEAWAQQPVATSANSSDEQVILGVFMESLCPDSRRFFNRQLVPTYRELAPIMALNLVPFGHARVLGDGKMVCQHGPRECEGNRRMACVLARAKNDSQRVETIGCLFAGQLSIQGCIEKNLADVKYEEVESCTKGDESYQLMVKAEAMTGSVDYVPHLTVNGEWSNEIQDEAEHELKKLMCQKYKGQKPVDACKSVLAVSAVPAETAAPF